MGGMMNTQGYHGMPALQQGDSATSNGGKRFCAAGRAPMCKNSTLGKTSPPTLTSLLLFETVPNFSAPRSNY